MKEEEWRNNNTGAIRNYREEMKEGSSKDIRIDRR